MDKKVPTKAERLNEIKDQERFYKALDKIFDRDWKAFVNGIRQENAICNRRLCRVLAAIKGEKFVADLLKLMKLTKTKDARIRIVRMPTGILFKEKRVPSISEIWVDQNRKSELLRGCFYVQVKAERWLRINY